jgi:tRNA pseudouridine38-40 synthase
VYQVGLRRIGGEIHFRIVANRFLHAMVRILIGWLSEVGRERLGAEQFAELLLRSDLRTPPPIVAPPQGLCLLKVQYPHRARG